MTGDDTVLLIGTRKGLWVGRSDAKRQEWAIEGPHFPMMEIYSCLVDTRDRPRLLVRGKSARPHAQELERLLGDAKCQHRGAAEHPRGSEEEAVAARPAQATHQGRSGHRPEPAGGGGSGQTAG